MGNSLKKFFIIAVSFTTIPLCCFAIKSNDFTKASASAFKRYQTDKSNLSEKSSNISTEKLDTKMFYDSTRRSNLRDKESRMSGKNTSLDSSHKYGNQKRLELLEYNGDVRLWDKGKQEANFVNSDKNFTKKYKGKIDITKRNREYQDFIEAYYGNLVERSMEDINKYYSRSASDTNNDKYVKTAGDKLRAEDDEGFFDFLSSNKKIKRKPLSFTGVEKKIRSKKSLESKEENNAEISRDFLPNAETSQKSSILNQSSQVQQKIVNDNDAIEESIDAEKAKRLRFLNVPEQFRSKASIKVKVKD